MIAELLKKSTDRVFVIIQSIQDYQGVQLSDRMMRFMRFFGYKVLPFLVSITTYFTLFWILNKVYTKYGFERVILVVMVILILKKPYTIKT